MARAWRRRRRENVPLGRGAADVKQFRGQIGIEHDGCLVRLGRREAFNSAAIFSVDWLQSEELWLRVNGALRSAHR